MEFSRYNEPSTIIRTDQIFKLILCYGHICIIGFPSQLVHPRSFVSLSHAPISLRLFLILLFCQPLSSRDCPFGEGLSAGWPNICRNYLEKGVFHPRTWNNRNTTFAAAQADFPLFVMRCYYNKLLSSSNRKQLLLPPLFSYRFLTYKNTRFHIRPLGIITLWLHCTL